MTLAEDRRNTVGPLQCRVTNVKFNSTGMQTDALKLPLFTRTTCEIYEQALLCNHIILRGVYLYLRILTSQIIASMATPNPLERAYPTPPAAISEQLYSVAGILTTVYGLKELNPNVKDVACLWLLHPRLQTQQCMKPVAASAIQNWNERIQQMKGRKPATGLIAVSFDQRNHGLREVDKLANQAWNAGNKRHAQDMFSIYRLKTFFFVLNSFLISG